VNMSATCLCRVDSEGLKWPKGTGCPLHDKQHKHHRAMFLGLLHAHQDLTIAFGEASSLLIPGASCLLDAADAIEREWNRLTETPMPKLDNEKSFVTPPLRPDLELRYSAAERVGLGGSDPTKRSKP